MSKNVKTKEAKLNRQDTRQALINAGTAIILEKGFNHTGIEQVLRAVNVPKGSFYYYFKSKDDFGLSIIDYHAELMKQDLEAIFQDTSLTAFERLRYYFDSGRCSMKSNECRKGCLFGNLGQEMADQNEAFRIRLAEVFHHWCAVLSRCIREAQEQEDVIPKHLDPDRLAEYLMYSWEGAVMRCKVTKDLQPIDTYIYFVFEVLLQSKKR